MCFNCAYGVTRRRNQWQNKYPKTIWRPLKTPYDVIPTWLRSSRSLTRWRPTSPRRTLQYRLKYLVDAKRLVLEGKRRWTKYRLPQEQYGEVAEAAAARDESEAEITLPLSKTSADIRDYLRQPTSRPANRSAITAIFWNRTGPTLLPIFPTAERARLRKPAVPTCAATRRTYAKQLLSRFSSTYRGIQAVLRQHIFPVDPSG